MFFTAAKRGKMAKRPGIVEVEQDLTPSNMYDAVDLGGGRPDSSRRFTNVYGKNARARNEVDLETGQKSREAGRMFSWMKGESY